MTSSSSARCCSEADAGSSRSSELAGLARPEGPWVVIDGYHAFMAVETPFGDVAAQSAFYLGGGYKYAMSGEGCAFLHAPPGFGARPPITGWFAEFEDLTLPPGSVGYRQGRHAVHGRDVRRIRPLPIQRRPPDAVGERPDHGPRLGARRPPAGAFAGCAGRDCAGRRRAPEPSRRRALPRLPDARMHSAGRASSRSATASPTCAATCFASGSRSIMTKRISRRSRASRRTCARAAARAGAGRLATLATSSGIFLAPNPEAQPEEDVHAHDRPGLDLGRERAIRGDHFALVLARLKPSTRCARRSSRNASGSLRDRRTRLRR